MGWLPNKIFFCFPPPNSPILITSITVKKRMLQKIIFVTSCQNFPILATVKITLNKIYHLMKHPI